MHTIIITGADSAVAFAAPADRHAARSLWVFLVENLQGGLLVELTSQDQEPGLVRQSGRRLPTAVYTAVMGEGDATGRGAVGDGIEREMYS